MNKIDVIARRIMGWKLNNFNRWYDLEKSTFILDSEFQPDQNLEHAMLIVERFERFGFKFTKKGDSEVCFNDVCANGDTLAAAITNAAYLIAENSPVADEWF